MQWVDKLPSLLRREKEQAPAFLVYKVGWSSDWNVLSLVCSFSCGELSTVLNSLMQVRRVSPSCFYGSCPPHSLPLLRDLFHFVPLREDPRRGTKWKRSIKFRQCGLLLLRCCTVGRDSKTKFLHPKLKAVCQNMHWASNGSSSLGWTDPACFNQLIHSKRAILFPAVE